MFRGGVLRKHTSRCFFLLALIYSKSTSSVVNILRSTITIDDEDDIKPIIYTFFEPAYNQVDKLLEDVEIWKNIWRKAGWNAIALTLEDAKRHNSFEKFRDAFDNAEYKTNEYNRMCFYRWLAVAASGGGWMSDYDTLPLYSQPLKDGFYLPNDGRFTSYGGNVPCLVSGSKEEWERMVELIFYSYQLHTTKFWSDMNSLVEIDRNVYKFSFSKELTAIPVHNFYEKLGNPSPYNLKSSCNLSKKLRAIHFSHSGCKAVSFCYGDRGSAIEFWFDTWSEYCVP